MYSLYHGYGAYGAPEDAITITQVKNGQDALNLMSQVLAILPQNDVQMKSFSLWQAALTKGPLTNANIVKMFQQMREWLQAAKMDAADKKVLNAAYWYYCNVEKPGICNQKSSAEVEIAVATVFAPMKFYQQPWFYWTAGAVVVLGIGAVIYSKMQD